MAFLGANAVGNVSNISNTFLTKPTAAESDSGKEFKNILNEALEKFEGLSDENAQSTMDLLTGSTDDLSDTMIASQKSEIALNLTVAIRNKAVEAYKEIMNMQV